MFTKIGTTGGQVTWNFSGRGGKHAASLTGKWFGSQDGDTVYGWIKFDDEDQPREFRGRMGVERAILSNRVFYAKVESLTGAVKGESTKGIVKEAVEDYLSLVLREFVDQRERDARPAAEKLQEKLDDVNARVRCYVEAMIALELVDDEPEIPAMLEVLRAKRDAGIAERKRLGALVRA